MGFISYGLSVGFFFICNSVREYGKVYSYICALFISYYVEQIVPFRSFESTLEWQGK